MDSFVMDRTEDILSPLLMKIGNRLYRKNPTKSTNSTLVPVGCLENECEPDEDAINDDFGSDQTCYFVEDIHSESGGCVAKLYVPRVFYSRIIGTRQVKKHELESEFLCRLTFPSPQSTLSHIKIFSKSEAGILGVVRRIAWIISESRSKMNPTHFVCIPLISNEIKGSYLTFKKDVLKHAESDAVGAFRGIDDDLFVSEHKLHFTLATLFLADQKEVRLASQLLTSFMDHTDEGKTFDRSPLCLTICGLGCMNDDPRSAQVLYLSVNPIDALLSLGK
ncbi:unnamed protein product [Hydatigera taeniaeformis]|uniref:AKAP7_NLS domain-containing protein n=1 Tax=Hydatigena taeniaeformis TaxID=6205 RepID=A0A0R3WYS0_HYDTA|nr:unnamed protein product [Hydatigera taeniaeformis]